MILLPNFFDFATGRQFTQMPVCFFKGYFCPHLLSKKGTAPHFSLHFYKTLTATFSTAARIIQNHFRAFLVRKSRTLRQLKDLASIKSIFNTLKSSVSKNPHLDPQLLFNKALGLRFKLDSIQGGDPMIRDGKKSISQELIGFLDLIDGAIVKKSEISAKLVTKNAPRKCGGLYNEHKSGIFACRNLVKNKRLEDLVDRIDALFTKVPIGHNAEDEEDLEIPGISRNRTAHSGHPSDRLRAKVKKSVSFVENGKAYRIHRKRFEPVLVGDCDSSGDESYSVGAEGELKDDIPRKAEEVGGILQKWREGGGVVPFFA